MRQHFTGISEFAFIDPGVSDLGTLLQGLRPEITAVVLGAERGAVAQIADHLAGCRGLSAIHIIAHGAPGEIGFTAGRLSLATISGCADDLARIGDALDVQGELLLWSCETGQAIAGERFIAALEDATGATIGAATGLVGAAAKGGRWELDATVGPMPVPPLTGDGISIYRGVLPSGTINWTGPSPGTAQKPTSGSWNTPANWSGAAVPGSSDTVVLGGTNAGSAYTVTVDSAGSVGTLSLSAANGVTLDLKANLVASTSITIGSGCTINDTGATGTVTLNGGTSGISNSGTIAVTAGTLSIVGSLTDNSGGAVTVASGTTLTTSGSVTNSSGATITINGTFTETGTSAISNAGTITLSSGTLQDTNAGAAAIGNSGTINSSGTSVLTDGNGGITNTGTIHVTGGTLTVTGALTDNSGGALTIDSGAILTTASALTNNSNATITVSGTLTTASALTNNSGATITVGGTLTETGTAAISNAGTITLSNGTLQDTHGAGQGGAAAISNTSTGIINSSGTSALSDSNAGISNSGLIHVTGGTLTVTGALTDNSGGALTIDSGAVLTMGSALTNNSGATITVNGALGTSGALTNNLGGQITLSGTLTETGTAAISNAGTITLSGGTLQDTHGAGAAAISNSGTINSTGTSTLSDSGGGITNLGTIHVTGGTLTVAGALTDSGVITIDSLAALSTSGALTNNSGATITINGTLSETGTVAISNAGTISIGSGATLSTAGALTNQSGGQITVSGTLTESGTAAVTNSSGATITLSGGTLQDTHGAGAAAISNSGTINTSGTSTLSDSTGGISNSGTLNITGGTLTVTGAVTDTGTISMSSGASLTDSSGITLSGGALSGAGTVNASLSGTGTVTASGGTLDLTGTVNSGLTLSIADVVNSVLRIDGTATTGAITLDTANQTLEIGVSGTSLTLTTREHVTGGAIRLGRGTLADTAGFQLDGGTVSGIGAITGGTIDGTGVVEALGGQLDLSQATIGGDATGLEIANDGSSTLVVDNAASGAVVTFLGGSGTLRVLHINDFFATISALQIGSSGTTPTNQIDLADVGTITRSVISGSTVTFYNGLSPVATLHLASAPGAGVYADWTSDSVGGNDIFLSTVACFCAGTQILTQNGEMPVETLKIGDRVMTVSGAAKPIRWIGRRAYSGSFIAGKRNVLPIRVAAGALADGVPVRDLWVSPGHAFFIDNALVQCEHLINGVTVVQAESVDGVEYFHIELDAHDVIFADGAPAESYVECDNRMMFTNAAEHAHLYPVDDRPSFAYCAPRPKWGSDELTATRAALLARVEACGYGLHEDPDVHLVVDGEILRPQHVVGRLYRFDVPAGAGTIQLASRSAIPAEVSPRSRDRRRLGIAVQNLVLSAPDIAITVSHSHAALSEGFWKPEVAHRWTDGYARVPDELLPTLPAGSRSKCIWGRDCAIGCRIASAPPPRHSSSRQPTADTAAPLWVGRRRFARPETRLKFSFGCDAVHTWAAGRGRIVCSSL
jgi:hypothetical protein